MQFFPIAERAQFPVVMRSNGPLPMPRKNSRSRLRAKIEVEVSAEAKQYPDSTSAVEAGREASPVRQGRLHHLIKGFACDIPSIARPGGWFSFRGRMTRQAFWLFYIFNIMMISAISTSPKHSAALSRLGVAWAICS